MPPPDKIRPLIVMRCTEEGCEFRTTQEWAALRHEADTRHAMGWPKPPPGHPLRKIA
jgi:hypothetical protein